MQKSTDQIGYLNCTLILYQISQFLSVELILLLNINYKKIYFLRKILSDSDISEYSVVFEYISRILTELIPSQWGIHYHKSFNVYIYLNVCWILFSRRSLSIYFIDISAKLPIGNYIRVNEYKKSRSTVYSTWNRLAKRPVYTKSLHSYIKNFPQMRMK